jgi:hypothetical protein
MLPFTVKHSKCIAEYALSWIFHCIQSEKFILETLTDIQYRMVSTVDRQYPAKFFKFLSFDSLVLFCEATKWSVLRIGLALFCEKVLTENEMHHYFSSPIITTSHHLRGITPLSTRSKSNLFCSFAMVSWSFVTVCFWFCNENLLLASLYRIARICKCVRSPGIDSQPGGPVRQPYLTYRVARPYRMAEMIPFNQFLGSLNVYKFGLRTLTNVLIYFFSYMLNILCDDRTMLLPLFIYSLEWRARADAAQHSYMQKKVQVVSQPYSVKKFLIFGTLYSFKNLSLQCFFTQ